MLIIEKNDVSKVMNMKKCIDTCEKAFALTSEGKIINYPRLIGKSFAKGYGGLLGIAFVADPGYLGEKLLTRGISIIYLVDYKKGVFALIDGTIITDLRTGAGGAVSAKHLAKKNSESVGVIGSGNVAKNTLWALCEAMQIKNAKVYSRTTENRERYAREMEKKLGIVVTAASSIKNAVQDVDIIVTATKAEQPTLLDEHVQEGVHIVSLGNPPELDPKIFLRAKVFSEFSEQSKREGKLSYAIESGVVDKNLVITDLGDVILARKPGRVGPKDITIFDCQGLTAQDVVTAWEVYSQISGRDMGRWLDLDIGVKMPEL